MTHFSDGVRTGQAGFNGTLPPGIATQPGTATSPIFVLDVLPTATLTNNLAAAATVSNAAWTISGSTGTTTTTINGVSYVDLGCSRNITASGASTAVTAVDITATGLDEYLVPVTATFSGPASTALTSSVKTMRYFRSAYTSGNTTSNVAIGTGDVIGFPYRVNDAGYVRSAWNGDQITTSVGFTAGDTTTATAYTSDVRGTQLLPSASDGTARFVAFIYVKDPDSVTGLYGVTQA